MKSKQEKQLAALEDSQGCLAFWEAFLQNGKPDRVYFPSKADYRASFNGETEEQLCKRKIAHHQKMIETLKAKLSII